MENPNPDRFELRHRCPRASRIRRFTRSASAPFHPRGGVKFAGTESTAEVYRNCREPAGHEALIRAGSPGALRVGELEWGSRAARISTFGGGVGEVQREIVATKRLGMKGMKRGSR